MIAEVFEDRRGFYRLIAVEGQAKLLVHLEPDVNGVLQLEPGLVFLDHLRTNLSVGEREDKDGCEGDHDAVFQMDLHTKWREMLEQIDR